MVMNTMVQSLKNRAKNKSTVSNLKEETNTHGFSMEKNIFLQLVEAIWMLYGCFLKWWYPTTMGFPTKNDHFGVFGGYHQFKETPIYIHPHPDQCLVLSLSSDVTLVDHNSFLAEGYQLAAPVKNEHLKNNVANFQLNQHSSHPFGFF